MWRSLIDKLNGKGRKRGYTLMELLAVIIIVAIVSAIAVVGIFNISRTLKFKQRNDYAKTIFMAAQANLSEMRSDGSLYKLQSNSDSVPVPQGHCGFPGEDWSYEYEYTSSEFPEPGQHVYSSYDLVLPANSVESVVRNGNVIIEYNPKTGNVYAVFFCDDEILSQYRDDGTLPRNNEETGDEEKRKKMMLGYYDGSGLSSSELDLESTDAYLVFDNEGQEGILTVKVPVPESYYAYLNEFMDGLTVKLTIVGELSGGMIGPFDVDMSTGSVDVDGRTVMQEFVLDSLTDFGSFANMAAAPSADAEGNLVSNTQKHLSDYIHEEEFTILPGENIQITAEVDFEGEREVDVEDAVLSGVNPMLYMLEDNTTNQSEEDFVAVIQNGRHLQNLNALAPSVANKISAVTFHQPDVNEKAVDIYWNETVDYYNNKYGGASGTYTNSPAENPCRGLPYFVPIHNENLFGTATFQYPDGNYSEGSLWGWIGDIINDLFGNGSTVTTIFKGNVYVPTLTDELDGRDVPGTDKTIAQLHATIEGYGGRVYYLNIDSSKYAIPNANETEIRKVNGTDVEVNLDGMYYATGTRQIVDYQFTGLFGYVNTSINDVHVVNPIVKGNRFVDDEIEVPVWGFKWKGLLPQYTITGYTKQFVHSNPATGALVGAAGYNTLIENCSTYIDTKDPYFSRAYMGQDVYNYYTDQDWYGVSGQGAVGGLVGYAKSHRTTSGELTNDTAHLAFRNCFAAVNVSGHMRGNDDRHYGYSNGVGGLIGNSQLTNFYNCYASGNVIGSGMYLEETTSGETLNWIASIFGAKLDLPYNGRTSIGVGGFVGTSHGTRYTKCFATGSVEGTGEELGAGGFVGIMSLDESFSYGNSEEGNTAIVQTTILTECYSVGLATCEGKAMENFSGANARIAYNSNQADAYITSDYYRLYAPKKSRTGKAPDYSDTYIFRDSYYLSGYFMESPQENSNSCSTPELYSTFTDLVKIHNDPDSELDNQWRTSHINEIKGISVSRFDLEWLPIGRTTYGEKYFDKDMDKDYEKLYSQGYQSGWASATEENTHPYNMNAAGAKYPFTKLENLDYYGDWPSKPSSVGLAYYETYKDADNKETDKKYYYDSDKTSKLHSDKDTMVYSDGYAVLTATQGTVKVKVGDKTYTLKGTEQNGSYTSNDTFYTDIAAYHVYVLTDEIMDAAMAESKKGEFYVKLTITDPEKKTYVTYFNPAIALTQVNPIVDPQNAASSNVAVKPKTIPSQLYIRSARQFAALSDNQYLWGKAFNYYQQFHIDAEFYKGFTSSDAKIGSIGTAEVPFEGTYYGNGGYVDQAKISGFQPTKGFFGTVSSNSEIKNLDITVGKENKNLNITVGDTKTESVGVLAGVNGGVIDNVDLIIHGSVTVNALNNAALLVGQNVGTSDGDTDKDHPAPITNCTVKADDVVLHAANAGGLIGEALGEGNMNMTPVKNNDVTITKLTSDGGMVGGMAGVAEYAQFVNSNVTTELKADNALYAGGFAGAVYESTVTTLVVDMYGDSVAQDTLAGLAGAAYTTDFTAASVELDKKGSFEADMAAGAFGAASQVNVKNSAVFMPGRINGSSGAAGFAYQVMKDSVIQLASVTLTGGGVTASDGKAAGYAVENAGTISGAHVYLGTNKDNAVAITGKTEAVGFAGTVSGNISSCSVHGKGQITATEGDAAGFAGDVTGKISASYVTPANSDNDYKKSNNGQLPVSGQTVAGFALSVGGKGTVSGSYTLCDLRDSASASGFAAVNEGTISESTSNVTQTGGAAFVGDNSGKVSNCYGWYGNGDLKNKAPAFTTNTGKVTSSYFANINDREGKVELYNNLGNEVKNVAPSQITLAHLNAEGKNVWGWSSSDYGSYPYTENLKPGFYPYPMLRSHYGDWVREIQYAYGVIYYEQYSDGSLAYEIKDLSDPSETVEGEVYGNQKLDVFSEPLKGNEVDIVDTGYVLFHNKNHCPFPDGDEVDIGEEDIVGEDLEADHPLYQNMPEDHPLREGSRYKLCELAENKPVEIKAQETTSSGETSVYVVPYFAKAFGSNKEFEVRTPEQLSYVGNPDYPDYQKADVTFRQTHTIEVETLGKIETFVSKYIAEKDKNGKNSELKANSAPDGWMNKVYGEVRLLRLAVDEVGKTPIFGEISGTVSGKTFDIKGDIQGNLFGTVKKDATLSDFEVTTNGMVTSLIGSTAGTVSDIDLFCKAETTIKGSGILTNAVTGGTIENCDVTMGTVHTAMDSFLALDEAKTQMVFGGIAAQLPEKVTFTGNTVSAEIFVTGEDDKLAVVGGMIGYSDADITGGSADVTIHYTQSETDMVGIGGLVAWAHGGSVSGANVAGAIDLEGTASGRTGYYIGGAVAYDGGAEYSNIVSTVIVDPEWAGCTPVNQAKIYSWENEGNNVINPSGAGPVGKFVGYVTSGKFTKCTAIDNAESGAYNLQFLGEIQPVAATLADISFGYATKPAETSVVYKSGEYPVGTHVSLYDWLKITSGQRFEPGTEYRLFEATMTDCYFDYPGSQTMKEQRTDLSNMYFFQASPQETITNFSKGTSIKIAFNGGSSKKIYSLRDGEPDDEVYRKTKYFYKENNKYYYLYLKVGYAIDYLDWVTEVEVAIDTDSDGTPDKSLGTATTSGLFGKSITVYELQNVYPVDNNNYMIVNESDDTAVAWDGNTGVKNVAYAPGTAFDSDNTDVYRGVWKYGSANSTFKNFASELYLFAGGSFGLTSGENQLTVAADIPNGCTAGTDVAYKLGSISSAYNLYTITEGTHWYRTTFGDSGLFNHICGYQNTDLAKTEFVSAEELKELNAEEDGEKPSSKNEKSKSTAVKTSGGAKKKTKTK